MSHHRYLRFVLIATIVMAAGCEETQTLTFGTGETDTSTVTCTLANEPYGTACECDAQCASNKCSDDNKCICNNSSDCNGDTPYCSEGVCVSCNTICSTGLDIAHECVCDNECNTHPESPECINDIPEPQVDCLNINSIVAYFNNSPKINALVKAANQENATESEKRYGSIQEACGNLDNIKVYTGTNNNVFEFSGAKDKACIIICGELTTPIIPSFDIQKTKHIYGFPPSKKNESSSLTADEDFKNNAIIHFTPITPTQLSFSLSVTDNEYLTIDNISLYYSLPVVPTQAEVKSSDAIINEINNTTIQNIHLTLPKLTRYITLPKADNTNSNKSNNYGLFANTATNSSFSHIQIDTPDITVVVNKPDDTDRYVDFNSLGGFIGKTTNVEIDDLTYNTNLKIQLDDLDSTYTETDNTTIKSHVAKNIGGIAGSITNSNLTDVHYNGNLTIDNIKPGLSNIGGIAGKIDVKNKNTVDDISYNGQISLLSDPSSIDGSTNPPSLSIPSLSIENAGGLIGTIVSSKESTFSGLEFNSNEGTASITISPKSTASEGDAPQTLHIIKNLGGLIGNVNYNSSNRPNIYLNEPIVKNLAISIPNSNEGHEHISGMIGASVNVSIVSPTVEHLSIDASQAAHVGGLMGHAEGEIHIDNQKVEPYTPDNKEKNDTYTEFNTDRANIQIDSIKAKSDVGGIVGHIKSSSSENKSHKLFISNINVSNGTIQAIGDNTGGIVGNVDDNGNEISISNLNHTAKRIQSANYTGGLIGKSQPDNYITSLHLYNISNSIHQLNATSLMTGSKLYIGGIAAYVKTNAVEAINIQSFVNEITDNTNSAAFISKLDIVIGTPILSHHISRTNSNKYINPDNLFTSDSSSQIFIYTNSSTLQLQETIDALNTYDESKYQISWGRSDPVFKFAGDNPEPLPCFTDFKIYNDGNDSDPVSVTCNINNTTAEEAGSNDDELAVEDEEGDPTP